MDKLFIANRGEIACRIAHTAHRMGIQTCGVYTPQDVRTKHVRIVQQTVKLPYGDLSHNYLNQELLISVAKEFGADAIHPGYGFLSENPEFATKVIDAGLLWVGPSPNAMRMLGGKIEAKQLAAQTGVPVTRWAVLDASTNAEQTGRDFGFPLLIKAAHGGGGRGQRVVRDPSQFAEALRAAQSESQRSFGSPEVFLETFLENPRHIEVQILGDEHGNVFILGERDCTLQRRNQKILEETPASLIDDATREQIHKAARMLASAVKYRNAGTIEFLAQQSAEGAWNFFFMELNARLQVEHPVTEMVTGLDLVELQIRVSRGERLVALLENLKFNGHAIEVRLTAEDPRQNFLPTPGPITLMDFPVGDKVRIDSGYDAGDVIPQEYDSLFAKLIVHAESRPQAIASLSKILEDSIVAGTITNKFYLEEILRHPEFRDNKIHTRWIEGHAEMLKTDETGLDQDITFWGKKLSSELLVQRNKRSLEATIPTETLTGFEPDSSVHGNPAPQGVCIAGHFQVERTGERIYAAGWVSRFEICVTFQKTIQGVGQRRIVFAGQHEIEDLRAHHGPITAQVPGVVLEIRAKPNEIVEALQPILIVEAMKIEMPFTLPISAKIMEIHVKPGDRILPGQTLVTWEPTA